MAAPTEFPTMRTEHDRRTCHAALVHRRGDARGTEGSNLLSSSGESANFGFLSGRAPSGLPSFRRTLHRKNMMAANYRHIGFPQGVGHGTRRRRVPRYSERPPEQIRNQWLSLTESQNTRSGI